ncbi:MAG TPA: hypothetical protein VMW34_06475 [Anaerolineales bacterium]|nr:hypothetical protein [Anaerolineales bacterium]
MKKLLFLLIFYPVIGLCEGPIYQHKDPFVQLEIENIYKDIRSGINRYLSQSSVTSTYLMNSSATATYIPYIGANTDINLGENDLTIAGTVTQTAQPSFLAISTTTQSDVTGDSTEAVVVFGTKVYDLGDDFSTQVFTAPVGGKYWFGCQVRLDDLLNSGAAALTLKLNTANRDYWSYFVDVGFGSDRETFAISAVADMDANDTAHCSVKADSGTKTVEIDGNGSVMVTYFSGSLIN